MNPSIPDSSGRAGDGKIVPFTAQSRTLDRGGATVAPPTAAGALLAHVEQVRSATAATPAKTFRRLLFFWFRVYVRSNKRGKAERVNVAIPIPIPLLGLLFPGKLSWNQALQVATLADDPETLPEIGTYLESCMGLELVRVEQDNPDREHYELVVVGLD